jgi:leader peptidase (prepilin peptidase)/N-methyltransferase
MDIDTTVLAWAIAAGIFSWLILMPMIRKIPFTIAKDWQQEAQKFAVGSDQATTSEPAELPKHLRMVFVLAAVVTSFCIFSTRGVSNDSVFFVGFVLCMLLLAFINVETQLLPDKVSLTVLWIGLVYQSVDGKGAEQISGAALGYALPYIASLAIRLATGREFLGYGDMKTFGMAGAWVGIDSMPTIFGVYVVSCIFVGIATKLMNRNNDIGYLSTGPMHFLATFAVGLGLNLGTPWA